MISSMALVLVARVACRANCRPLGQYPGAQLTVSRLTVDVPCTVGRSFWQVESTLVA